MPFSHHSHSGQFCGHATNTLEEVVETAIAKGMTTLCLTEHIPRDRIDFYPGEENKHSETSLIQLFDDYYTEARRLQVAYKSQIQLFVGFEGEWIRTPRSLEIIQDLFAKHRFDLFVGSVHHVHTIPIDYDTPFYHRARDLSDGTDAGIFADYFDAQLDMLKNLHPPVVGHFDLIRLKADDPDRPLRDYGYAVWEKVLRNLRFVASYGGVLEVNSSALRKGLREAYPQGEICRECKAMGGRLTLSDDSHGIGQLGAEFKRAVEGLRGAGVGEVVCLAVATDNDEGVGDERFKGVRWQRVGIEEVEGHVFFRK